MRRRILAGIAAAAMVTGGAIVLAESPAEAHPHDSCVLLHLQIQRMGDGPDVIHFCI